MMDPPNLELVPDMVSKIAQELTFARAKIKEMEIQAGLLQNRADAAEYALRVMAKNFEEISAENHRLKDNLSEFTDSKAGIMKQETMDGTVARNHPDLTDPKELGEKASAEPTSAEANGVPALQQALELYYQKYKAQKEKRRQLRDEFDRLKAETEQEKERLEKALGTSENSAKKAWTELKQTSSELENKKERFKEAMKQLSERTKADAAKRMNLSTRQDVEQFMSELPKPTKNLPRERLEPVCLTSLDLKAYIECDTNIHEVGTNFLCLPDRIVWCLPERVHALALGPMHLQDHAGSPWRRSHAFDGLYGKTFHLFYTVGTFVFYAGFYKAIDLRKQCPGGISAKQCRGKVIFIHLQIGVHH
ncbi:hypothetical protein HYPSUDRAFT_764759 [Hypholoma sublateritium FD-334 SS-4]|uniref:Uncharacterized protein n=1 Tax=Hypholoma sublateritium (strain FD-334 SS-4) TaxID=945553 RepID=A0A0D2NQE6_HYPSF|nr:hypothetical protein HYPSUDRAFT_764759 [Hypholoma sublateritium FD-334 SS-4]